MTIQEVQEKYRNPQNKDRLPKQIKQESRLRLHTELNFDYNSSGRDFLSWVSEMLPSDKFLLFESLLRPPIDTTLITGEALERLSKIFDGQDPVKEVDFKGDQSADDWSEYWMKFEDFIKRNGFEALKRQVNAFVVVDLPTEQTTSRPEPYPYFLDIRLVEDYCEEDGSLKYISFQLPDNKLAWYCDEYYRVYDITKVSDGNLSAPEIEAKHNLGMCPAFRWYSDREGDLANDPISKYVAVLDWMQFYITSKKCADIGGAWEITWQYSDECEYEDDKHDLECDKGYLRQRSTGTWLYSGDKLKKCPHCSSGLAGAGSHIRVDFPDTENGEKPVGAPVGRVPASVDNLEYNGKEVDRLEDKFMKSVTGFSTEIFKGTAINEKQVMSMFEDGEKALMRLQAVFEKAESQLVEIMARLRYGDSYIGNNWSYGTKHHLLNYDLLYDLYQNALEKNADSITLDMLQDQCFAAKYRNNPREYQRVRIELNIDPLRHLSKSDAITMHDRGLITSEDLYVKMNLSSLKLRFERENGNMLEFGELLSFDKKIDAIRETIYAYVPEMETKKQEVV